MLKIIINIIPLLIAVILHEIAHGYVAKKLGDPTASDAGRLTLNPIKHIDPFFTILLPAMLVMAKSPVIFGGAKPVPVDPRYFKKPRRDMMWVAFAGPATNIVLAFISFFLCWGAVQLFGIDNLLSVFLCEILISSIFINVVLAVFNLFPVPPLDGSRILAGILPWRYARSLAKLEKYGLFVIFALLYFNVLDYFLLPAVRGMEKLVRTVIFGI